MKKKIDTLLPKLLELLSSDFVTEPTRNVLLERMEVPVWRNVFFDDHEIQLLSIVCDLLIDQDSSNRVVEISLYIDKRLAENKCDGWRYNEMPPDGEMYKMGLKGINTISIEKYNQPFIELKKEDQLTILLSIQQGKQTGSVFTNMSSALFFEELLTESAETFFSHPLVQADMGYVGMADAKGWHYIGINESENVEKIFD